MKVNFKGYDVECSPVELLALLTENAKIVVAAECGVKAQPKFDEPKPEPKPEMELTKKEAEAWGEALTEPEFDFWEEEPVRRRGGGCKKVFIERECGNGNKLTDEFDSIVDMIRRKGFVRSKIYPYWKMEEKDRFRELAKNIVKHYDKHVYGVTIISHGKEYRYHNDLTGVEA